VANEAKIEVRGLNKLVSTMRRAGVGLDDMKDANRRAGDIVAAASKQASPRLTGKLAASIRPARQARKAVVRAGGSGIRYARFQEFGSAKNPARRYLYGSAERTQPEWTAAYFEDLEKIIGRITGE
jgi:HK97 gp10 family phage protein